MSKLSASSRRSSPLSRRGLLTAGGALGAGALLSACGGGGGQGAGSAAGGSWTFTDDRKKKVGLDAAPERIVAYVGTAAALHDFGVDQKLIAGVFGPTKRKNGEPDVLAGEFDIGKVEIIGNAYGEFDIEKYAKLRPDLLITNMYLPGELWYVPDESKSKILKLAPSVAMTVAKTSMKTAIDRFAELAESLGADLKGSKVTASRKAFEEASERLRKAAKAAKAKGGLKVLAASGYPDLFYVSDPRANADLQYFRELGVDIVVPSKVNKDGFFEELSWENADRYQADVIMLDNRTQALQPPALKPKPAWSGLAAVEAGQITEWMPEPRFSYAGTAPLMDELAKALEDAGKVR